MKLFHLFRVEDQTGVSGTGPVVEGVEFTNGWCAIRWMSNMSSLCFYQSIEDVKKVHGHQGRTELVVHDFEPLSKAPVERDEGRQFDIMVELVDQAARVQTLASESSASQAEVAEIELALSDLRALVDDFERTCRARLQRIKAGPAA